MKLVQIGKEELGIYLRNILSNLYSARFAHQFNPDNYPPPELDLAITETEQLISRIYSE